ncbi:MAG: NAD(P)/FAD-dependent oxidoreductase [Myxococcales bacterium]|nr:NAD(P)/FAD-dependent oxidoreductase [Myxococcales bacterium]
MKRAVVIGSGLGGLTSARLLQQQGMHVTVLERHYRPGGFLHRFFRPTRSFDTGFHYCGSVASGAPFGQVLRHIGVFDKLSFSSLDPDGYDRLIFPDMTYSVPVGWDRHAQRLKDLFPHDAAGIDAVCEAMQRACDAYGFYRLKADSDLSTLLEVESVSVAEVLSRHLTDPKLRAIFSGNAVLYGVPPWDAPFGLHALTTDHFMSGAHSIAGGGDALALALVRRIRRDGGEVHLRTKATRIEVDGRLATAVHTDTDKRFEADVVVSNLHPRLTHGLLPEGSLRPAARTRVNRALLSVAHFGLYLTVDGRVPELGRANAYVHSTWDTEDSYRYLAQDQIPVYFASAPSEHSDPPGPGVVLMILPVAWEPFAPYAGSDPENRPAGYRAHKEALMETALSQLYSQFPELSSRVLEVEASTPVSTLDFTGSPQGAMYGHHHNIAQMGRNRPAWRTRVKNVLMVGQGVSTPGLLGAAASAYYAVGHLFGLPKLIEEMRDA